MIACTRSHDSRNPSLQHHKHLFVSPARPHQSVGNVPRSVFTAPDLSQAKHSRQLLHVNFRDRRRLSHCIASDSVPAAETLASQGKFSVSTSVDLLSLLLPSSTLSPLTIPAVGLLLKSIDTFSSKSLSLAPNGGQNAFQASSPHHQSVLDLSPLLLAEHPVGCALDKEFLLQLRQLALDETCSNGVNDPYLNVLRRHLQRRGNSRIRY